jgi:hypothetical protein
MVESYEVITRDILYRYNHTTIFKMLGQEKDTIWTLDRNEGKNFWLIDGIYLPADLLTSLCLIRTVLIHHEVDIFITSTQKFEHPLLTRTNEEDGSYSYRCSAQQAQHARQPSPS